MATSQEIEAARKILVGSSAEMTEASNVQMGSKREEDLASCGFSFSVAGNKEGILAPSVYNSTYFASKPGSSCSGCTEWKRDPLYVVLCCWLAAVGAVALSLPHFQYINSMATEGQVLTCKAHNGLRQMGFTKYSRPDYIKWKYENRIVSDGVNAKLLGCHGPSANRQPGRAFLNEKWYVIGFWMTTLHSGECVALLDGLKFAIDQFLAIDEQEISM
ncbi:unnamed protein product [Fraxinus pennsylvanica]|uniref:Uncharacterized protein n=1 Tax=Fraxinus pennsylvanica TaxID=56036 RepID=A0AAD2DT53_9LAMI|nr:unnamed protein product [Fraxinus pennsylvanica]